MLTIPGAWHRKLVQRIGEEFEEMPGLRLSVVDAARFWGLDDETCEIVLRELTARGLLTESLDHRFHLSRFVA